MAWCSAVWCGAVHAVSPCDAVLFDVICCGVMRHGALGNGPLPPPKKKHIWGVVHRWAGLWYAQVAGAMLWGASQAVGGAG